jgi:hypothetical protein
MHRRWRRLVLPAVVAVGLLATACGGASEGATDGIASAGDGSAAKTASDKKDVDPQQAGLDFARCMREHGVDMPDPTGEGGMVMIGPGPGERQAGAVLSGPPAGFQEADKECRHHLEGLIGDGPGPLDPAEQDKALKFAKCMRDNGIDMPDPDFSGGGVRITIAGGPGSTTGPDSETFKAAQKACGGLFGPAGGGGFSTGPVAVGGARS